MTESQPLKKGFLKFPLQASPGRENNKNLSGSPLQFFHRHAAKAQPEGIGFLRWGAQIASLLCFWGPQRI